ncbi:hypothetical protein D3C72_1729150 [compost metagenome]
MSHRRLDTLQLPVGPCLQASDSRLPHGKRGARDRSGHHLLAEARRRRYRQRHRRRVEVGHPQQAQIALHVRCFQRGAIADVLAPDSDGPGSRQHIAGRDDLARCDHNAGAGAERGLLRTVGTDGIDTGGQLLQTDGHGWRGGGSEQCENNRQAIWVHDSEE